MVTLAITTQQTGNVPPPKHLTHPPNLHDKGTRTKNTQQQITKGVLFNPLR